MTRVFYWEGIFPYNSNEFAACEKQINALLQGQYQTADLDTKKMRGYKLYTARLNHSDRLLFTTITIKNKSYLMLLEVIYNHDYQKSKYLKNKQSLKKFIDASSQLLETEQEISQDSFECFDKPILESQEIVSNEIHYEPAFYYQERFITLSEDQGRAQQGSLPMVVSGPPGSGKSCVGISVIKQSCDANQKNSTILYITKSKKLTLHMQSVWQELPESMHANVRFMTYDELMLENKETTNKQPVGFKDFVTWYHGVNKKSHKDTEKFSDNEIYQEMHICSSVNSMEDYLNIGKKNSLLVDPVAMKQLFVIYKLYLTYLEKNNLVNFDFFAPKQLAQFDQVIVDESQDFPPQPLLNLFHSAINKQILFCIDTHQSLFACKSILPFLENLVRIKDKVQHIKLALSYRCGANIIHLANEVITIKNNVVGGVAVKGELTKIQPDDTIAPGSVHWYKPSETKECSVIQDQYKPTDVAIVTHEQYKEEAKTSFNSVLVFTPDQVKGLEYKLVIAYRFLDLDIFKRANKMLNEITLTDIKSRCKVEANAEFGPCFNQLFTTITRAIESFVLVQNEDKNSKTILLNLKKKISLDNTPLRNEIKTASAEDWKNEYQRQIEVGNHGIAQEILEKKLGTAVVNEVSQPRSPTKPKSSTSSIVKKMAGKEQECIKQDASVDKSEVDINFVKSFLKNPSDVNLLKILRMENKRKMNKLLFEVRVNNRSIFEGLTASKESIAALLKFGKDYLQLLSSINSKVLYEAFKREMSNGLPLLCSILVKEGGADLFHHLFLTTEVAKEFSGKFLGEAIRISGPLEGSSVLYWLVATVSGRKGLATLFRKNPKLIEELEIADVCRPLPSSILHKDTSSLYWLTAELDSQAIFWDMILKRPQWANGIPSEAFYLPMSTVGRYQNMTPFLWLSLGGKLGLPILVKLFEQNSRLITEMRITDLTRQVSEHAGELSNLTPLIALTGTEKGIQILTQLFEKNPALMKEVTEEHLLINLPQASQLKHPSAIALLLKKEGGQDILRMLAKANPQLEKYNPDTADISMLRNIRMFKESNNKDSVTCNSSPSNRP